MSASIFGGKNLALYATLSEARTDYYAILIAKLFLDVFGGEKFGIDECDIHLMMMVCGSVRETLADGLVSILQIVFSYETDIHHFGGRIAQFEEVKPRTELRSLADRDSHLAQNSAVKSLTLHIDRHLIDAWKVLALDDAFQIYIAETSHFHPHIVVQM